MSRSFAEITALFYERRKRLGPVNSRALDVREQYNGDVVIPLPELDRNEKNAVANLLNKGLNQMSMRTASTRPDMQVPPLRPGIKKWEDFADDKRKVLLGWDDMNRLPITDARKFRHYYGYGRAATVIVPDFTRRIPRYELRDPLQTYPALTSDPLDMTPEDCIFAYHQSGQWLKTNYPNAWNAISRRRGLAESLDELFQVIEYIDAEDVVIGVLGNKTSWYDNTINGAAAMELVRTPNRAGVCTAVVPQMPTLDRPMGMYDGMLGMYWQQSMLQALSVIATKKGIFKDEWIIARQGEIPKIVQMADGLSGEIGIIQGGDIKEMGLDPSYMAPQMIDRLEQYQRQEAGVPEQMTGSGPTNSRTGRASDSILSATVDFTIQESQRVLAYARQEENKRAIAVDKGYWKAPKSFYVSFEGGSHQVTYKPTELWDPQTGGDHHFVNYSFAGSDENALTVEIGQLIGTGLMSKEAGRYAHPKVKDPKLMGQQVTVEALEQALLASLQQQAANPQSGMAVTDYVQIIKYVEQDGMRLTDAALKVHNDAQARQAPVDAQGQDATVQPGSPDAQPGLNGPGVGAEAPTADSLQAPPGSMQNFQNTLRSLRRPTNPQQGAA